MANVTATTPVFTDLEMHMLVCAVGEETLTKMLKSVREMLRDAAADLDGIDQKEDAEYAAQKTMELEGLVKMQKYLAENLAEMY